jgi:hypothetical protein
MYVDNAVQELINPFESKNSKGSTAQGPGPILFNPPRFMLHLQDANINFGSRFTLLTLLTV